MITYIALLRGINFSGQNKIPMAELRASLTEAGFKGVQTYIQSGNVVFKTSLKEEKIIAERISKAIFKQFGFEVSVLVKTPEAFKTIFGASPFSEEALKKSYFMLLFDKPKRDLVEGLLQLNTSEEQFKITDDCIYFYSVNGYGKTKFNNNFFERKLKVIATARNYNTMLKLLSLSAEY
ncbi:DUF1697 domain-containing protein [Aestuariibaculum suncheonense]|uniref:DUF1697 domain-containing protein n=1 Tax=Aestuariibaculum suncheonense TaxID=1028745 RepID=A0A8J6UIK0_9FLAO|nr:DUF1697 domain-containing protein [Aestuariibaculum suncheonense]MBD0834226.1 DUF1697 domain-containing protein [Aestuariibaculum suncheonense]